MSTFPDRFRLDYRGAANGTYEVNRRNGAKVFDLDRDLLGTDQNTPPQPLDPIYVPQRIECRRVIDSSDGTKCVMDYEGDYSDSRGNTRTIRLADMVYVEFHPTPAGQPANGYYPPA